MADRERIEAVRQIIRHRLLKDRFDKHRDVLDEHKERGPAFAQAVERLERIFGNDNN